MAPLDLPERQVSSWVGVAVIPDFRDCSGSRSVLLDPLQRVLVLIHAPSSSPKAPVRGTAPTCDATASAAAMTNLTVRIHSSPASHPPPPVGDEQRDVHDIATIVGLGFHDERRSGFDGELDLVLRRLPDAVADAQVNAVARAVRVVEETDAESRGHLQLRAGRNSTQGPTNVVVTWKKSPSGGPSPPRMANMRKVIAVDGVTIAPTSTANAIP